MTRTKDMKSSIIIYSSLAAGVLAICLAPRAIANGTYLMTPPGGYTPPIIFGGPAGAMAKAVTNQLTTGAAALQQAASPQAVVHEPVAPAGKQQAAGAKPMNGAGSTSSVVTTQAQPQRQSYFHGHAIAVSGNTLAIDGRDIQIAGVVAPKADAVCRLQNGLPWNCGADARHVLAEILSTGPVTCRLNPDGKGVCSILGQPVNQALIGRN